MNLRFIGLIIHFPKAIITLGCEKSYGQGEVSNHQPIEFETVMTHVHKGCGNPNPSDQILYIAHCLEHHPVGIVVEEVIIIPWYSRIEFLSIPTQHVHV